MWKRYGPHQWRSDKSQLDFDMIVNTRARFDDILRVRTLHEQVLRMLPFAEREQLVQADLWSVLASNPIYYNPYTHTQWKQSLAQFDRLITPAVQMIAGKLKAHLKSLQGILCGDSPDFSHSISSFIHSIRTRISLLISIIFR